MDPTPAPAAPDPTEVPNASRIYNYTLGGTHNFPADRAAAEYMFSLVPSTPKWVRMLRAFMQRAARRLRDEGYTHFVDFASGLPLDDHIHHVLPDAKVVYSDVDPYTLEQAQRLVAGLPNVLYLRHDVRDARALLERPEVEAFLGGERRVVFGLNGITVFLSPEEIRRVFHDLYDWAAPGSRLYITYETKEPGRMTPRMQQFVDMFRQMDAPFWLYSLEESVEMSAPWRIPEGGLVPVREFLGLPEDHVAEEDHEGVGLEFYAAILEKPE
ncbi:MAG TPA: SAM-dependent methyltransferase [Longimicrobiaceae bacterium]|nr:SAM-dependent methyltransferase [Longimicrobiaceae bacterium]